MATSVLLLASWLAFAPPQSSDDAEPPAADLSAAKRLFDEGLARYETADYEGAIEVFTLALSELSGQGVDDFAIRGLLRFNIGRAHVRAYEIDHDVEHLRQAQTILRRLLDEAKLPELEGMLDEQTIADAEQQLRDIDALLAGDGGEPPGPEQPGDQPRDRDERPADSAAAHEARTRGIALLVPGVALIGAGVGMLAWGASFGPAAEQQVLSFEGTPADPNAGDDFIAVERRKGAAWMAGGAIGATLGVVGVAIGIQQLVKAKRLAGTQAALQVSPSGFGLIVSGRF